MRLLQIVYLASKIKIFLKIAVMIHVQKITMPYIINALNAKNKIIVKYLMNVNVKNVKQVFIYKMDLVPNSV